MINYKEILEDFYKKIADGSWLDMSKEEIEEMERIFDLYEEPKERGAGDDYPIIEQK